MAILYINIAPCVKLKKAFFEIIYRKSRGAYSLLEVIISVCTYLYIGEKRIYETRDRQFQLTTVLISYEKRHKQSNKHVFRVGMHSYMYITKVT